MAEQPTNEQESVCSSETSASTTTTKNPQPKKNIESAELSTEDGFRVAKQSRIVEVVLEPSVFASATTTMTEGTTAMVIPPSSATMTATTTTMTSSLPLKATLTETNQNQNTAFTRTTMVTSVNDSTDHCTSRTAAVEVVEEEPSLQPHPNRKRKNTASPINLTTTTATESVATKRVVHAFTVALPASSTSTAAEPPECNGCGGVAPPPTSTLPTEEDTGVAATLPEKVRKKKRLKAKTHRTETAEGGTSHPHQSRGGNRTSGHSTTGRWTADEHRLFLQGLAVHGREWKRVAANIATRTSAQVRSHAQKYFAKLEKSSYHNRALADDDDQHSEENERGWRQLNHHQDSSEDMEMSDSVRREAARILANPETVESEVRETLERLSERYRHLRERLLLQQPQLLQHQQPGGLAAVAVQEDDELIALHVLQGGLQHQQQQQPPRPNSPLAVAVAVESDTEKAVDDEAQTPCATTTTMLGSKKNVDRMQ